MYISMKELEPHAPYTYQWKQVPGSDINSNKCEGTTSISWISKQLSGSRLKCNSLDYICMTL